MYSDIFKRIKPYMFAYKKQLIIAIISLLIGVGLTLLSPVLVGRAIDFAVGYNNVDFYSVYNIIIKLIVIIAIASVFTWVSNVSINTLTYKTIRDIRKDVFKKINNVPLKYIDTHAHGDIISRIITDIDYMSEGLLQGLTQLFSGAVTVIGIFIFMLYINPVIALVVVLITPLSIFVASFISKRSYKFFKSQSEIQGKFTAFINEMLSNQKIIKSYSYENEAQKKLENINNNLYSVGVKSQFYSSLANPGTRFINAIVYTAVGIIGAYMAITKGNLSVGEIACFLTYANQYTKPFNELTGVIPQLQSAVSGAKRVFDILDEISETDSIDSINLQTTKGNVSLENVSFSYNPKVNIIDNLSLNVKSGQKVAITGPTGSGKTTIINLLMRFYDVDSGVIRVDGIDITKINRASLRALYGMVLQDTWLYSASIRDNIAFGKPNASDEEILLASKKANAHSFIKKLENGYDTIISENAGNISQGQKQLLCIARVMLMNPQMQILDEATSNIDTVTEQRIGIAFDSMMKDKTSFVVAHRLSTIKNADVKLEIGKNKTT